MNKMMEFNDGEGLVYTDLQRLQYLHSVRWLDEELYSRLTQIANAGGGNDPSQWDPSFGLGGNEWFVKDNGWGPWPTGLNVQSMAGIAIKSDSQGDEVGDLTNDYDMLLQRAYTKWQTQATVNANTSGSGDRYDLIQADILEAASDSQSRDFKDATTGALSTQSLNKRRTWTPSVSVVEGTPSGTPSIPAPTGENARWCAVRVPDGGGNLDVDWNGSYPGIIDFTYPCANGLFEIATVPRLNFGGTSWTPDPGYTDSPTNLVVVSSTTTSDSIVCLPPPQFIGDPAARLLNVILYHSIVDSSLTVELGAVRIGDDGNFFSSRKTFSIGTTDGNSRGVLLNCHGSNTDPTDPPMWCNGQPAGRAWHYDANWIGAAPTTFWSAAIRITKGANTDLAELNGLLWSIAR